MNNLKEFSNEELLEIYAKINEELDYLNNSIILEDEQEEEGDNEKS